MGKIDELIKQLCPKGVENIRLGDYCNILNGFAFKSKQYVPEGVRVIRISDVQDGYISSSDKKFYPKTFLEETDKYNLYNGDLVMSLTGNCGRVAFIKHCMLPAALNQRVACLRSKKGLDIKYLFYILFNKEFQKAAMQSANGAGQKNLSTTWLSSYILPLPPLAVQKKIVEILDTFTGMISNLQKELEQRQKQFEYYCENLVGSAKGEVKTLGEIGRMERGTGLQKSDFRDTGVPCIHYGQIHTYYNTVATETKSFCSEELAKKLRKAKPGDLLIATTSEDVEACCKATVWLGEGEVAYSGDSFKFSHNQNPKYIAYLFKTEAFSKQKRLCATGAKVVRVSGAAMEKFKFSFPSLDKQQEIVDKLDTFEALISNIKQEIELRQKQYEYYREKLLTFE